MPQEGLQASMPLIQRAVAVWVRHIEMAAPVDLVAVDLVVHSPVRRQPLLVQLKVAVGL